MPSHYNLLFLLILINVYDYRDNSVLTSDESSASAAGDTPSHRGGGGGSISSSDTESWTIIDDAEGLDDSNVALFTDGSVAKFAKSSTTSKSAIHEDEDENPQKTGGNYKN